MLTTSMDLDRLTITERLSRYAWGYDIHDMEMLRGSFTSDATFSMHLAGGEDWGPFVGREAIVEWMAGFMKAQADQRRHSMTNVLFDELTDTRAVVRCFLVLTAAEGGTVRLVTTGQYQIEMEKQGLAWRIHMLNLFLDGPF
jgi:hypothetical protein